MKIVGSLNLSQWKTWYSKNNIHATKNIDIDSSLAAAVAMAPSDSGFDSPATAPFDSCPIDVSADSCPTGAP